MRLFTHKERDLLNIYADIEYYARNLQVNLPNEDLIKLESFFHILEKISLSPEYMTEEDMQLIHDNQVHFNRIYHEALWANTQNKIFTAFAAVEKPSIKNLTFASQLFEATTINPNVLNTAEKLVETMNEFVTHREVRNVKRQIAMEQTEHQAEQAGINRMI